jgi:1-aminocyclopropane-1-carboxylate deaminase/D-cysteine desulfhydrase-like pyridoxal-dependent ACC family enzyme
VDVDFVIHASGSGGTQAGLAVGAKASSEKTRVFGISVSEEKSVYTDYVADIAMDTLTALEMKLELEEDDIVVFDEYLGEGYGEVDRDVTEAIRLMSVKEGIFLDPVYTGKAMVALIDLVKKGYFGKGNNVVFFHTGGTAALFPNKHKLSKYLGGSFPEKEES